MLIDNEIMTNLTAWTITTLQATRALTADADLSGFMMDAP